MMRKTKVLVSILSFVIILSVFTGCQSSDTDVTQAKTPSTEPSQLTEATVPSDEVTEPSSEATEPSVPENLELTIENIKTHVKEGLTYAQVKTMFGKNDQNASSNPINCPNRLWYMDDTDNSEDVDSNRQPDTYLRIEFRFPGYNSFDQWFEECVDKSTIPTEVLSNGDVIYDMTGTDHLAYWTDNMEAVCAILGTGHKVSEVLFCQDGYHYDAIAPHIDRAAALNAALSHAGFTEDEIMNCQIEFKPDDKEPHYKIEFDAASYAYEYEIHSRRSTILKVEREFEGKLTDVVNSTVTRQAAIEIAMSDPLVPDSAKLRAAYEKTSDSDISGKYYEVMLQSGKNDKNTPPYLNRDSFEYRFKISVEYNVVLDLEISLNSFLSVPADDPEDGRLGLYAGHSKALQHILAAGFELTEFLDSLCFSEGHDTAERSNYYEAYFEYKDEGWYYYIDMYTGELLSTEKVSLD